MHSLLRTGIRSFTRGGENKLDVSLKVRDVLRSDGKMELAQLMQNALRELGMKHKTR